MYLIVISGGHECPELDKRQHLPPLELKYNFENFKSTFWCLILLSPSLIISSRRPWWRCKIVFL